MSGQSGILWVVLAVGCVTCLKLFVSWVVIGTSDAIYWTHFADVISRAGSIGIYDLVPYYNHPPLISWGLAGLNAVDAATGWPFPFLVRLAPIFADAGSIFVIWALLQRRRHPHALALTLVCCLNPVSFLVSAYHGNTDPVLIFLVLLAVFLGESRRSFWAGLVLGLSLCIKIVPLIFLLPFWFWLRDRRERAVFSGAVFILPLVVFIPVLFLAPGPFFANVFKYSGLRGIWGFGHLFLEVFDAMGRLQGAYHTADLVLARLLSVTLPLFLISTTLFSWKVLARRRMDLIEGLFVVTALFLILTPGFGVQYLFWIVYFAVLSVPALGTAWIWLAGAFLLKVYEFWGGLGPPYFADSDLVGAWRGADRLFDLGLWVLLFVLLSVFFKKWSRRQKERGAL